MSLEGRVAIVTGAGTLGEGVGVGKAISITLAKAGAKLVLLDLDKDRVAETERLVAGEGAEALVCLGNVVDPADCERVIGEAVDAFGTVDILVNSAAASIPGSVVTLTDEEWATMLDVCLMGAVRMSRFAVPVMQRQHRGAIVNISSIATRISLRTAAYAAAKAGLEALTRDLAVQHGRDGIRANAVLPGLISTPRTARIAPATQVMTDQSLRKAAGPLGIEGNAWDVAWAVDYLVSDRARFVTGVCLPLDGGVLATTYMTMASVIEQERTQR